jgi:hypothetical protein
VGDDQILKDDFDASAIAARRVVPRVFLVGDDAELIAWSTGTPDAVEPEVRNVIRRYVCEPPGSVDDVELVRAGGEQFVVRILPYHKVPKRTFAVIVERFALRDETTRRT